MDYRTLRGPLLLSVAAAVTTIGLKFSAYYITGSAGLFSDALESLVNLFAALAASLSLWYSTQPPDPQHTYGHLKIEFFSSGLEGMLVLVAGLATIWYAIQRLIHPQQLEQLGVGILLAVIASIINFAVAWQLLRVGRKYHSIVLEAGGHHLMSDVLTTVGVVGGLGLVSLTQITELDALLALAVGLHILFTGFKLIRRSFDGLMDHALTDAEVSSLREAIRKALPAGADFHHLRTRRAGRMKFADLHMLVDGSMNVRDAHVLTHQVEAKLAEQFPELDLTIHVEPIEDQASWESKELEKLGEAPNPAPNALTRDIAPPIDD